MKPQEILELAQAVNLKDPKSVSEAVNHLLEDTSIKAGDTVAVLDDPSFAMAGAKGKVKKVEGGYADVELMNKSIVPLQVSLLLKA